MPRSGPAPERCPNAVTSATLNTDASTTGSSARSPISRPESRSIACSPATQPDRPEGRLDAVPPPSLMPAGCRRDGRAAGARSPAAPARPPSRPTRPGPPRAARRPPRRSRDRRRASRATVPTTSSGPAGQRAPRRCRRVPTAGSSTNATAFAVSTRLAAKSLPVAASTSRGTKPSAWQVARIASWAAGAASRGNRTTARSRSSAAMSSLSRSPKPPATSAPSGRVSPRAACATARRRAVARMNATSIRRSRSAVARSRPPPGTIPQAPGSARRPGRRVRRPHSPGHVGRDAEAQRAGVARPGSRATTLSSCSTRSTTATRLLEQQRTGRCEVHPAGRPHQQLDARAPPRAP